MRPIFSPALGEEMDFDIKLLAHSFLMEAQDQVARSCAEL